MIQRCYNGIVFWYGTSGNQPNAVHLGRLDRKNLTNLRLLADLSALRALYICGLGTRDTCPRQDISGEVPRTSLESEPEPELVAETCCPRSRNAPPTRGRHDRELALIYASILRFILGYQIGGGCTIC